jgi:hypothetical protein
VQGGGGEVVAHSRDEAPQGLSLAAGPWRRLRTTFTMKSSTLNAMVTAPIVEMRFSVPQPISAGYVYTRRGIPCSPR